MLTFVEIGRRPQKFKFKTTWNSHFFKKANFSCEINFFSEGHHFVISSIKRLLQRQYNGLGTTALATMVHNYKGGLVWVTIMVQEIANFITEKFLSMQCQNDNIS